MWKRGEARHKLNKENNKESRSCGVSEYMPVQGFLEGIDFGNEGGGAFSTPYVGHGFLTSGKVDIGIHADVKNNRYLL